MTAEAEARKTLINTGKNLTQDVINIIAESQDSDIPLDGDEIEIITKKLYRVIQTLKTAQSLPTY